MQRLFISIILILSGCSSPLLSAASDGGQPGVVDGGQPSTVTTALSPAYDGGMAVSCAPDDSFQQDGKPAFPACSFVGAQACRSNAQCGCGCSCQCGVCNCDAAGLPGACTGDADCGPSCLGLSCAGGQCVSAQTSPLVGIWTGMYSWPTTVYGGMCGSGLAPSGATGTTGGPITIQVIGQGSQLAVLLTSQQSSGQSICRLPFVGSGNQASLVSGSACVTPGAASQCDQNAAVPVAIQTFMSGSATLDDGGTLTLQLTDVFATPAESGPECVDVPAGQTQVNVESMTATLQKASS